MDNGYEKNKCWIYFSYEFRILYSIKLRNTVKPHIIFNFDYYFFQISNIVHISSMVDEYMSCDRLFGGGSTEGANARSARQLLETIPCDMKKQSFCANKGTAYPE